MELGLASAHVLDDVAGLEAQPSPQAEEGIFYANSQ